MSHFVFIEGSKSIQSLSNPHSHTGSFLGLFVFAVLYEDSTSVSVIIIAITSIIMTSTVCCVKSTSIVIAVSLLALQSCRFVVNISGNVQHRPFVISIVFK